MSCEKHGYTNNVYCPECDLEGIEEDATRKRATEEGHARAAICRKYAEQYYNEVADGELPNLALIINDAIGEGIELFIKLRAK